ncbi:MULTISPECIES: hydroxymethylglutaryl-CoA reductase, degradative [unclassified Streptococcus]|uniref:hydroxymethylglutaryl-CoA reductase, degradative n=1 Tax=unclassified Streptococcus TaxID=2608887 RepID=UPI00107240E7|nr:MULTISPECIES: hydroxymethylglutaryl-CoA reductase, degradative [unclassified Streptococcus]MBF0786806.1 hydroxymethylglutaryl-CoA reductase, degradative [Streptococcus sp. 19428wC2_LYSM12]MCQ9211046.1 hydroxymethylglutaryl-CoA reductase, degradative [Streptococcus sp. B01]MCQ9214320.1 hydroxymethylglutaryl-CoA reductase, degradative [Streptococcus sp. O1]TFV06348.1 hydroxymethylglutaryl-CoA reductase, degradative [Streptococcus sp. LYSM12]
MSLFSGFYKKTREERIAITAESRQLSSQSKDILFADQNISEAIAGKMAENHLGTFALPFSLVPQLVVDGIEYSIPMVTEEPSVVAACSFGAKMIAKAGGFTSQISERLMIGQVALYDIPDMARAKAAILLQHDSILAQANRAHPSIIKRGGGARQLTVEQKEDFLIAYLHVDVQEAMGANILNNMLEAIKEKLADLTQGKALMAILSNYATESLVTVNCRIPIKQLHVDPHLALETAQNLVRASQLAQVDPYRAATHNKGIFNGIDALVLATGNDWRAMEAGAHAYASQDGRYRGLSTWDMVTNDLVGQLTIPLPIATVGGSIGLNPKVQVAFDILGHPKARTLAAIIASVGLCQNFAALRALVTTGIQQGHMKLHAKSLAILAGALEEEVDQVALLLRQAPHTNLETAQSILAKIRKEKKDRDVT